MTKKTRMNTGITKGYILLWFIQKTRENKKFSATTGIIREEINKKFHLSFHSPYAINRHLQFFKKNKLLTQDKNYKYRLPSDWQTKEFIKRVSEHPQMDIIFSNEKTKVLCESFSQEGWNIYSNYQLFVLMLNSKEVSSLAGRMSYPLIKKFRERWNIRQSKKYGFRLYPEISDLLQIRMLLIASTVAEEIYEKKKGEIISQIRSQSMTPREKKVGLMLLDLITHS